MRQLHVVAVSEDGRHVVLATSKGASRGDFRVALDDRLAAAVRGDLPRPGEAAPAAVTPKEIQARLRAGESPEQIAAAAGLPVARIERYAGPVLSERERVLAQARAGFVSRSRLGQSALPLGEAVDLHLSTTTGVRPETVQWSTRREDSGSWLVELVYVSQARRRTAAWRYDVVHREVTPTDNNSAVLAHVEPGRRSKAADAVVPAPAGGRSRARRTPVRDAPAPVRTVTARPATGTTVAAAQVAPPRGAGGAAAKSAGRPARKAPTRAQTVARAQTDREAAAAAQAEREAAAAAKAERAQATRAAAARAAEKAAAQAAKKAAAQAAKKAAQQAAKKAAEQEKAEAARVAAEQEAREAAQAAEQAARQAAEQPAPPTLRVVGAADEAGAPRRARKAPPASARVAPPRAAGQRAAVPGWADVLLSSTVPHAPPADEDSD